MRLNVVMAVFVVNKIRVSASWQSHYILYPGLVGDMHYIINNTVPAVCSSQNIHVQLV